jgi:lipopolysaccharide/colanic/teichoic acid biosynthesis glycosyltransferase
MVTVEHPLLRKQSRYQRVKAVLDVLAALVLVIVFSPILLLVAVAIIIDDPGPSIYRQQRVGRNGNLFTILKFRSMRIGTPSISTEEMQRSGINPFTRIGPLLRKTSLDELPQLFNILRGEMSFIGPRPALPSQVLVNEMRERAGVDILVPGITGLAQVMGRDDLADDVKVAYDAEYADRMSFLFDLRILGLTFKAVVTSRGNK